MEFKRGDRVFVKRRFAAPMGIGTIVQFCGSIKDENDDFYIAFDSFHYSDIDLSEYPDSDSDCHSASEEFIRHLTPLDELL